MATQNVQKDVVEMKQDSERNVLLNLGGDTWPSDNTDFLVNMNSHKMRNYPLAEDSSSCDTVEEDIQNLPESTDSHNLLVKTEEKKLIGNPSKQSLSADIEHQNLPPNSENQILQVPGKTDDQIRPGNLLSDTFHLVVPSNTEFVVIEHNSAAKKTDSETAKNSGIKMMSSSEYSFESVYSTSITSDVCNRIPLTKQITSRGSKKGKKKKRKNDEKNSDIPKKKKKKEKQKRKHYDGERRVKPKKRKKSKEGQEISKDVKQLQKINVPPESKSKVKKMSKIPEYPPDFVEGPWGRYIPEKILVHIFKTIVNRDGVFPLLPRVSRVCKLWNKASQDLSLWKYVDLSWGRIRRTENQLIRLSKQWLQHTSDLNLNGWGTTLTTRGVSAIAKSCSQLTSISLAQCTRISRECVQLLADHCPNLTSIDLSGVSKRYSSQYSPVSPASLKHLVSRCGKNLARLILAENEVAAMTSVLNAISESCPRLEELDISNLTVLGGSLVLFLEELQHGCPSLRILRAANTPLSLSTVSLIKQAQSPGFQELEELSIALESDYQSGLSDSGLERITKASCKLKLLDVRGCRNISVSGLVHVPAWDIQHLYLAQSAAARMSNLELVLQKWSHSLEVVDLSWANNEEAINQAIETLATSENGCSIRILDLSGSAISYSTIKTLLSKCSLLRTLNLQSCRSLPRGMKRLYSNEDLFRLHSDILAKKFEEAV